MGLPIWNYSDEKKMEKKAEEPRKKDPTATLRSNIRRRPSVHGRRNNTRPDATATLSSANTARLRLVRQRNAHLAASLLPPPRAPAISTANLPTPPPFDTSLLPSPSEIIARHNVPSPHPLSFVDPPMSPDNGLGDRRRSPSPSFDVWQIMRNTITPDDSLPSTSSSFTSAAAAAVSYNAHANQNNHSTASTRLGGPDLSEHDPSFEDTMREMGIEVSSSPPSSTEDSHSDSDQDDDSDTSDDDGNDNHEDDDDDDITSNEDSDMDIHDRIYLTERRRIGMRLYDIANSTSEGRDQIEAQRRYIRRHLTALSQIRPSMSTNTNTFHLPTPLSHSEDNQATPDTLPIPEPEQYGSEVHDRAQEAASRVRAYFDIEHRDNHRNEDEETDIRHISRMLVTLNDDIARTPYADARELTHLRDTIRDMAEHTTHTSDRLANIIRTTLGEDSQNTRSTHLHATEGAEGRDGETARGSNRRVGPYHQSRPLAAGYHQRLRIGSEPRTVRALRRERSSGARVSHL